MSELSAESMNLKQPSKGFLESLGPGLIPVLRMMTLVSEMARRAVEYN
jgi:hypothetical protein